MANTEQYERIGIGVITCNRLSLFRECIAGIPETDIIVVVNDGEPYPLSVYPSRVTEIIQHDKNRGVGRSKNDALRYLLNSGCRHIFLCEDDIKILHPHICNEYIRASERTGILHFNFAYHGPRNKSSYGVPTPRKVVDYGNGISIGLNRYLTGAFSYYREDVLRTCGLIDTVYKNMLEHVDHTYRIIREGYHPPFWWFADLAESSRFIDDLDPNLSKSTMGYDRRSSSAFFFIYSLYFSLKHCYLVQKVPDVDEKEVDYVLIELQKKFGSSNIR